MAKKQDPDDPKIASHVLVSGGARGLGLATVRGLIDKGYAVSTFSRSLTEDLEALASQCPERLYMAAADVASQTDMKDFVRHARAKLGPIYGLINNAATAQHGILATLPEVEIEQMISVNLTAAIKLTRLCQRDMLFQSHGRIINIGSIVGSRRYNGLAVYSATKAALDGLTRSLARELGPRGITVNTVAPGYMRSEMSSQISDGQLGQIVKRTPLGRLAQFDDVVPLIEFLLADGSSFISGQTILVDGAISN